MNLENIKRYTTQKITNEYFKVYPQAIFENLKINVSSGSFGWIHLSIESNYAATGDTYITRYAQIDKLISDFVLRATHRLYYDAYKEYEAENKKRMSYELTIYCDGKIVNKFNSNNARIVKNELIKILIAEKVRNVKTTYKYMPYTNTDLKIIEKFADNGTGHAYKYVYIFRNIDY